MRTKFLVAGLAMTLFSSQVLAQSACDAKDQTDGAIKASILTNAVMADSKGTCVFLLPDPAKGGKKYAKVPVKDVSYKDCVQRGEEAVAVKWFPEDRMNYKQIMDLVPNDCPSECSGFPGTCPGICYCVGTTHCE